MSAISLLPFIDCDNKDLDCCTIFKMMVKVDSLGEVYLNGLYGLGGNYYGSFVDGDLVTVTLNGIDHIALLVTHNLGTMNYGLAVRDENNQLVTVTDYPVDDNSTYIIIDTAITGTWNYRLFK